MDIVLGRKDREDNRKFLFVTLLIHLGLVFLLLLPLLTYPDPPPGQQGVLIMFGEPDSGGDSEATKTANSPPEEKQVSEKPEKEVKKEPVSEESLKAEIELQKRQAEINFKRQQEEVRRKAAAEEARKQKEEAERKKREYENTKNQFGKLLSGGGQGEGSQTGQQGDPGGDPNSDILKGISKGSGRVGGGLQDRGLLYEPSVTDASQETGKVVIEICVDSNGKVTKAEFTQKGSTTFSEYLIQKALNAANKYKFSSSETKRQCGTITFDFKVQ